jgi:hypothetical protein
MPDGEESPSQIVMRQIQNMIFPLYHAVNNQAEDQSQGEGQQGPEIAVYLAEWYYPQGPHLEEAAPAPLAPT